MILLVIPFTNNILVSIIFNVFLTKKLDKIPPIDADLGYQPTIIVQLGPLQDIYNETQNVKTSIKETFNNMNVFKNAVEGDFGRVKRRIDNDHSLLKDILGKLEKLESHIEKMDNKITIIQQDTTNIVWKQKGHTKILNSLVNNDQPNVTTHRQVIVPETQDIPITPGHVDHVTDEETEQNPYEYHPNDQIEDDRKKHDSSDDESNSKDSIYDPDKLYYDDATGERGGDACFCGSHAMFNMPNSSFIHELTKDEIIIIKDGKLDFVMTCDQCDTLERKGYVEESKWGKIQTLKRFGFIKESQIALNELNQRIKDNNEIERDETEQNDQSSQIEGIDYEDTQKINQSE